MGRVHESAAHGGTRMVDDEQVGIAYMTIAHMMVHMYELAIPVLVTVWITEFAVTKAVVGTIVTVGYGLYGVGALPAGILSDRFDSQRFIVICLTGMGASFLLMGFTTNIVLLTLALSLWGLAGSIYHPAGLALLSRSFTERGKAFGYHGVGANAGTVAGPLVTALLLFVFDWRLVTAILAIPAIVVAIAGVLVDIDENRATEPSEDETVPTDRREVGGVVPAIISDSRFLFASGFAVVLLVVVFNGLFYRGLLTFLPGILGDIATEQASSSSVLIPDDELLARINIGNYLFSGILVLGMGGQYLGGRITDYIPPERGLTATLGLLAIASMLAPTALSMSLTPILVVATVLGFLLFALQPFAQVTIAEYSTPKLRGLSFGYTYFLVFGVGSFSAATIGYVLTYSTVSVAFVVLAVIAASGSMTSFLLLQRREPGPLLSESPSTD